MMFQSCIARTIPWPAEKENEPRPKEVLLTARHTKFCRLASQPCISLFVEQLNATCSLYNRTVNVSLRQIRLDDQLGGASLPRTHHKKKMKTAERDVIEKIRLAARRNAGKSGISLGIGDDAALWRPRSGFETVLTCDWFLEGTHFLRHKHPPDSVGWKCLARAVSDIAAMGGDPRCFLLSLAVPRSLPAPWFDPFLSGLHRAAREFRCPLAGGDTTCRSDILINVTVIGECPIGTAAKRSGARPGDLLYVSGTLGQAELGLRLLRSATRPNSNDPLLRKHLYPEPRSALGRWLTRHRIPTAMMDLSDGLSTDLPRLCAASGVGARLESSTLPVVPSGGRRRLTRSDAVDLALHGGDDYELLFAVSPRKARSLPRSFQGIALTQIGELTRGRSIRLNLQNERDVPLSEGGWDPFRISR